MMYLNKSFFFILLNILLSDCDLNSSFTLNLTSPNLSITNEINISQITNSSQPTSSKYSLDPNSPYLNISQITNSSQPTPSKYSHDPNDNNRTAVILSGRNLYLYTIYLFFFIR